MSFNTKISSILHRLLSLLLPFNKTRIPHGVNLYYHSVSDTPIHNEIRDLQIKVSEFKSQLIYLKKHYDVVSLEKFIECYNKNILFSKNNKPIVTLTFDDGWKDNYDTVFPLIKEFNIPITIFLNTLYIENQEPFWFIELCSLLKEIAKNNNEIEVNNQKIYLDKKHFEASFLSYWKILSTLPEKKRTPYLETLKNQCPNIKHPRIVLNWDEIHEMEKSDLVRFAPHTHTHTIISELNDIDFAIEIKENWNILKQKLISPLPFFCYPNGEIRKNNNSLFEKLELKTAFTTHEDITTHNNHKFYLPRIKVGRTYQLHHFKNCLNGNTILINKIKKLCHI
ncbi:hypothetical protein DID76_02350 [Candidatus Marinamargulisbacteria bacterium SCGC AG-414-C22]|nr:hypothetical protein DID76_02350 [Candidatus Marinamargulisbacteria bacterium SCGC AG-414-C22]